MKQSTFSAQVANNLLTLLQGYSKTIRLLLVMFLTLTVSANVWGADVTVKWTASSGALGSNIGSGTIKTGTFSWNYTRTLKSGVTYTGWTSSCIQLGKNGGVENITFTTSAIPGTIKSVSVECSSYNNAHKVSIKVGNDTYLSSTATAKWTTISTKTGSGTSSGQIVISFTDGSRALYIKSISVTYEEAAATVPVTGVSLNKSTLTLTEGSSETLTATILPNDATDKTVTWTTNNSSVATVSSGKVTAIAKGSAIITVTTNDGKKTATCNVTVNPKPKYTVTWDVNGDQSVTTQVTEGSKPTFPATPSSCNATSTTFYGWATATWDGKIDDINGKTIYTSANEMPEVNGAVTYYAVFATKGAGGGAAFDGTSGGDFKIYALVEGEKKYLKGTGSKISPVGESEATEYTFTKISNGVFSIKTGTTYLTYASSTNLGTSNSAYSWTISKGTKGSWRIASTNTTARGIVYRAGTTNQFGGYALSNITANGTEYYDVEIGGGSSVSYSGYITTCAAGDPCASLQAPNVTATATANSITLSWAAVDGATSYNIYNYTTEDLDETTSLTYTFTGLSSETEYEWGVESAKDECFKETRGTTTTLAEAPTNYTVTLNPNYPTGKTGVFKDKEGNIINGNLEVLLPSGTASQALTNFYSSIELDNYAFDGFYTQAEGGSKRVNTGDITGNITFYAHWKEKYTITWSVNGNISLIEPTTFAAGDNTWEMPTTDYDCSGKGFVGWTTNPIIAAQDEAPYPLYTNASQFPNATATYHAVFAEGGSGGSGGYEKLTETLDDYSGEYLIVYETDKVAFNGGLTTLDATSNYISVTIIDDVIVSNATTDAAKFTFAKVDGGYSILSASGKYIGREATSNGLNTNPTYAAGYLNTITYNSITGKGGCTLKYNSASDQKRFRYFAAGQQAIALYKKSGSSATYTAYTTSCVASYSITYDFAGGTGSHCSNTSVPQGAPYTICDEPTKEGYTFLHWSDGTSTYAAGATITPSSDVILTAVWKANTYTVTWNSNGVTTSKTYNHGDALVVPTAPASCDGVKEFVGWTTHSGYYHATTAPDDIFTTKTTPVTATATYYAVFATPPTTGGGGSIETTDDVLTRETTEVTSGSTTYASWSGKTATSSAVYAGNSAGSNNAIQLRSDKSTSGIVTTTSGGKITHVEVEWQSATITDRKLDIYGRNVAYSAATDLYSTSTQGTKLGSITCGTSTELEITGDYEYIGLRSNSGAMYLASVTITWSSAGGSSSHTDYTTTCQEVTGIALSGSYPTTFIQFDAFSFAGGIVTATLENGTTQDVTELATFSGYNMDEVGVQTVTVTYMGQTAKYEITINQSDRWRLTWNVSGKTNTGASPIYVQKDSAIGTLPIPEVPAACAGKTFMGWTTSNVVNSDGSGITYITKDTKPTANTTYYAVFATVNNFCTQKPIDQIYPGSKVVIVAVASLTDDGGAGKAISSRATEDTYNLQGDDVAIYDQTINTPHNTCIWTINKEGGKYVFTQEEGKYLNAIKVGTHYNLKYNDTKDTWSLTSVAGKENTYRMQSTNTAYFAEFYTGKFTLYKEANDQGEFDMQFFVTANANGEADITDYTTGCAEYTITYYGFQGGYSTSCSSDGTIVLPVNSLHTIPNCGDVVKDHTNLNRTFTGVWMTQPHGGHTFKPGDTFILTQDTTLYAQWKLNTQNDFTTLPTDVEDLAGTDIYVYGGKTLTLQPGTTTINSLTLKGGIQTDGSYQMPSVWVPEGATLVRNSNKIYLDLVVNAENWYPFAVPFETKNTSDIHYLHPDMKSAAKYSKHFDIKTYDGARRADVGEDKANNWVRLKRHTAEEPVSFKPGVGYIISAMAYPGTDTATIRIPMTVPNTWFKNGEQAVVGTTVRNTIAVTAHGGEAATEHKRHAGWNFVANPYLSNFTGGGIDATNGLDYIDGELIIQGSYEYSEETVPYVTIPAYNFAYYSQHKLSEVKLSPEWSFFVQVGTSGTMDFTTTGRQQAPASIAARAEERPVKMDVDITLSDNHSSDQTGIIISDRYNDTYEIGRDLEKLFGSAYNLSVYTLMADNTPLAYQALAIRSNMQVIPVGYRAPEQGEYTFRLNEATSSIDLLNEQYEQLVLVDYQTGELTNLLISDYTFYSERTQADNRFAIYAVPRQNAPTDLPNAIGQDKQAQKIIHNGHLYILRDGNVYNGNGQIVK